MNLTAEALFQAFGFAISSSAWERPKPIAASSRGRERIHEVDPEPLRQLADFLAPYAAAWDDRLGRLTRHLEENP